MRRALLVLLALSACKPPVAAVDEELEHRKQVLGSLHQEVVAAGYAEVAERAVDLESAATAFCATPDTAGLDATRAAWMAVHGPWKRMEVVGFGPVVDEPYRFGPLLDFWPVREGVVDDLIASETDLGYDSLRGFGASTRGLPVLEYLLWHPSLEGPATFEDARRCGYLVALASDVRQNTADLHVAWQEYATRLADPGSQADFAYATHQQVLDEWVNRVLFALDDIRSEKLGKPLGDTSAGVPLPEAAESRFSGRSLMDARDLYAGAEAVLDGADLGLLDLMPLDRTPVGFFEDFDVRRQAVRDAFAAVPEPLTGAVSSAPATVVAAQDALRELQVSIQSDMTQALGVTLAFNDNDGD